MKYLDTRIHTRPSGQRHPAISGVHIIPEFRRLLEKKDMGALSLAGVGCPVCDAHAAFSCFDAETQSYLPDNTVHLLRARLLT